MKIVFYPGSDFEHVHVSVVNEAGEPSVTLPLFLRKAGTHNDSR